VIITLVEIIILVERIISMAIIRLVDQYNFTNNNTFSGNINFTGDTTMSKVITNNIQLGSTKLSETNLFNITRLMIMAIIYTSNVVTNYIPICCSCSSFDPGYRDNDDYIFVEKGCKILGNNGSAYTGSITFDFDNTYGLTPIFCTISNPNNTGSLKAYYKSVEITFSALSS